MSWASTPTARGPSTLISPHPALATAYPPRPGPSPLSPPAHEPPRNPTFRAPPGLSPFDRPGVPYVVSLSSATSQYPEPSTSLWLALPAVSRHPSSPPVAPTHRTGPDDLKSGQLHSYGQAAAATLSAGAAPSARPHPSLFETQAPGTPPSLVPTALLGTRASLPVELTRAWGSNQGDNGPPFAPPRTGPLCLPPCLSIQGHPPLRTPWTLAVLASPW